MTLRQSKQLQKEVTEKRKGKVQGPGGHEVIEVLDPEHKKKKIVNDIKERYKSDINKIMKSGLGQPEKIIALKKLVNEYTQRNKELVSASNRLKFDTERLIAQKT